LNLIGQSGTTPHEIYEDLQKEEKELLKKHKSDFKTLVKTKGIRLPANVTTDQFEQSLGQYEQYKDLDTRVKCLLHEYY